MGKGTMGNGTFQNISGKKGHFMLWETGHSTLWERFSPLGIGPIILWETDQLSFGIRDILWETGHAILWDSDYLSSGKHSLGIGNLGIGFFYHMNQSIEM